MTDSARPAPEEPASRLQLVRELLIFGAACLIGCLGAPFLIWAVGHSTLGPYSHGGAGALLKDFLAGLAHGLPAFWAVALGPYLFVSIARLLYAQARRRR